MRTIAGGVVRRWGTWAVTVASVVAVGGCYTGRSDAGDGAAGDEGGGSSGVDDEWDELDCPSSVSPLRRLSEAQYRNTLRDLFAPAGVDVDARAASDLTRIPVDDAEHTFGILDARVSDLHVRAYYRLADRLASIVVHDEDALSALAGACALEPSPGTSCIDDFLDDFGLRAYRRPLTAEERTYHHELAAQSEGGVDTFRAIIFSLLLSPQFLYHVEVEGVGDDERFALGAYALASRLSFHFWQTMPDDELFAAAADGALLTEEGYREQLDRVFTDPRTLATVDRFYDEWLHLGWITVFPDTAAFATFAEGTSIGEPGADHLQAAWEEIHTLTRYFTFEQDGTLSDLLLTDLSFTSSPHLAALYGVEPWDGISDPPSMPNGERAGILTRVALLISGTHETDPVHRGATVRRRILCESLPSPDPAALPPGALDSPPVTDDQTTRQRYEEKTGAPECFGCHSLINPPGFVLERYDAIGRHRTEEVVIDRLTGEVIATLPIDSTATPRLSGEDRAISTGPELSEEVLASGRAEACFATQYFRATFGRQETSEDTCAIDRVQHALLDGGSLREALRAVALDPMFRARRVK